MNDTKEVYFGDYCSQCLHYAEDESESPCWECLAEPMNIDSHKPLYFEDYPDDTKKS